MHNRTDGLIPGATTLQLVSKYGDVLLKQERERVRERDRSADISDAPGWAIELASRERLSVPEKAAAAWRLHDENRWSQAQIGKLFGITRGAVYNWLRSVKNPGYLPQRRADRTVWREQNHYSIATYHRSWRETNHHGPHVRADMWRAQDGRCYLCERPLGPDRMAVMEHDHRCCPNNHSCEICRRGLACEHCNWMIGYAGDDPDRLELIARNLRAALAGVTARLAEREALTCEDSQR